MKLASLKGPGRDGRLMVVSHDLARAVEVPRIAPTLQAALDDWAALSPALEQAAAQLERDELGPEDVVPFDADRVCRTPAARLSVRRRQRVPEPRRAGAPRARRRAAGRAAG